MAKNKYTGFTRVGEMYVRGTFHISCGADGVERALWAKMFPMLVVPEYYWFNYRTVGSITGTAPDSSQQMHTRGVISSMNLSQEDVETDDFDGSEIMDRYMDPRGGNGTFQGDDGDPPTQLGLSNASSGTRAALYSNKELWSGTATLGLPDKAVFSDANQITYVDRYSRRGKIRPSQVDIRLPHAIAMGATVDAIATQSDWSTAITGSAGGMNDLYNDILDSVGYNAGGKAAGSTSISSALFNYINDGVVLSTVVDVDQAMHSRVAGTVKCGVYTVDPRRQVLTAYR